jgi:hypothetical protein
MVQLQSFLFIFIFMVALSGMSTPILFPWLVNRDVFIGVPSFHGIIIPIFTSLLLVLVYIHFKVFICFMNKIEKIVLVRARPILFTIIIRKSSSKTRAKNLFILFFISYFHFFIFKFIRNLSYLESFCSVFSFLILYMSFII